MFGGSIVAGLAGFLGPRLRDGAPLTGRTFRRRLRVFDRTNLVEGAIFGVGWGLSGICPGAAYARFGVGNVAILWGIAGMFVGADLQGALRPRVTGKQPGVQTADSTTDGVGEDRSCVH